MLQISKNATNFWLHKNDFSIIDSKKTWRVNVIWKSIHWENTAFASAYLVTYPFFRALGAVAIFSLFMHISWTKSAATMFTSYMAFSNMSSTMGSKIAGYIKDWIPFDMTFILLGVLAFIPLIFLIWIDPDSMAKVKGPDSSIET